MVNANVQKYWEYGQLNLAATTSIYEVTKLRGGESITIRALAGNSGNVYIGSDKLLSTTNGFELDSSETVTLTLPITFGADNFIEIYAVTDNAGDDVCWVKLIDLFPLTEASSTTPAA